MTAVHSASDLHFQLLSTLTTDNVA